MAIIIRRKKGESNDRLLAKFRKAVTLGGLLPEIRDRQYFKSKSQLKKERLAPLRRSKKRRGGSRRK
jgi:ribosomal protein S21